MHSFLELLDLFNVFLVNLNDFFFLFLGEFVQFLLVVGLVLIQLFLGLFLDNLDLIIFVVDGMLEFSDLFLSFFNSLLKMNLTILFKTQFSQ